jgi:hypothetical protein
VVVVVVLLSLMPTAAHAQADYGVRIPSRDGQWLLPVATRLLGSTDDDHVGRGSINSWDLSVAPGTPVFAAAPGVVEAVGCYLFERRQWPIMQGYGCAVSIKHGNGIVSQYAHCKDVGFYVKVGDRVTANSLLCQSGQTGKAQWPHVHFTILRNGGAVRIDSLFDIRQMHYCKFCRSPNQPNDPIRGYVTQSPAVTGQPAVTVTETRYNKLIAVLRLVKPEVVSMSVVGVFASLCLIWWLGGLYERVFVVALGTSLIVVSVALWLVLPVGVQPVSASQQTAGPVGGNGAWKVAYAFMRKWEGNRCVHDPIRTLKGITQGTYSAWRMSQGLGPADVCANLTEQQAESIYYQRYWLASGANRLSTAVAIAHFDHAVNAGVGAAKGILAKCGDNIQCYIQGRLDDYRTKRNYATYGRAWTNRVNDLVKFLTKGG